MRLPVCTSLCHTGVHLSLISYWGPNWCLDSLLFPNLLCLCAAVPLFIGFWSLLTNYCFWPWLFRLTIWKHLFAKLSTCGLTCFTFNPLSHLYAGLTATFVIKLSSLITPLWYLYTIWNSTWIGSSKKVKKEIFHLNSSPASLLHSSHPPILNGTHLNSCANV